MKRGRGAPARSALCIDVIVESPLWSAQPGAKAVVRRAIAAAASKASSGARGLAILLTDDSAIRTLNRVWRKKNKATNVLSFPAKKAAKGERTSHLGDIVVAYETTAREAKQEGKPMKNHLAHLVVHGYLHLVGYGHDTDVEADAMESLETAILARLRVPNPYALRDAGART